MKRKRRRVKLNKENYFTKLSSAINFLKDYDENLKGLKTYRKLNIGIVVMWVFWALLNVSLMLMVNPLIYLPMLLASILNIGLNSIDIKKNQNKIKKHISKKVEAEAFVNRFKEELSKKGYSINEKSLVKDSKVIKIKNLIDNNKIKLPDLNILEKPSKDIETYRDMDEYDYVISKDNNFVDAEEKNYIITLKK